MAKDFVYKVAGEGDFGDLERELIKIRAALASAKGSVVAFKEELEKQSKGQSEYRIVIRSEYDSSGSKVAKADIQEVSKEYEGLLRAIRQVEREPQKGSVTSLRQQVNEAKQARDAIAKYSSGIDTVGNRIQALDGRWVAQNQRVKELQRELDLAGASNLWQRLSAEYSLKGFATAGRQVSDFVNVFQSVSIVAGQVTGAINNVVNALGNLQSFKLAFEAIGSGAGSANLALAESARISSGLGVDLKTTREAFQQLSPVILKTGGTIGDVSGVVETLSSRFAAYGISGDRARRVTNGVIQAFAKGKLMAEELTQQISEADPAFKTDFAGALGVTVAGLEELVKAGEITGEVFLKGLLKIGKSELLFGRLGTSAIDAANSLETAGTTVDQVRSKLATIGQLSLERFAKSVEPLVFAFLKLGAVVTDAFDRISRLQGLDSIGSILGNLAQSFVRIADAVLRFAEAGLAVIGIIAKVVNVLTSIPGVTDAIAIAIAAKLIGPLANLKTAFGNSISAATGWGKAIRAVTTFSGLGDVIKEIGKKSSSAAVQIGELTAKQEKLGQKALSTRADIASLQSKIEGYQKIIAGQKALPDFSINPQSQATVERYTQKILQNRQEIEKLGNSLLGLNADQYTTSASLQRLTEQKGLASRASGLFMGALKGVGGAAKSLITTIGPLGVILATISTLTSAYQNVNQSSNSILEQSKARVDSLNQALEALTGTTIKQEKPVGGLALLWKTFSFIISDAADTLSRVFSGLKFGSKAAGNGIESTADVIGRFAAAAGIGAAAGAALLGSLSLGTLAGVGAVVGTVAGILVAFASNTGDAALQTRQLIKDADAAKKGINLEAQAITGIVAQLSKGGKFTLDVNNAPALAAFRQAGTGLELVKKSIENLKGQKSQLEAAARAIQPPKEVLQAFNAIELQKKKIAELDKRRASDLKQGKVDVKLGTEIQRANAELALLEEKAKELAGLDPGSAKYRELQSQIAILNKTINESEAAARAAQIAYDAFAQKNGFLTTEQKKTIPTIGALNAKLKDLKATLENDVNPDKNAAQWTALSGKIATTTVELNKLQDAVTNSVNNQLVYTIKTKINSGEIANSVANIQRLVQALEERATILDIDSPALPGVLQELEEAKVRADQLNAKQATVKVDILEARGVNSTVGTLNEISRLMDVLEQKKVNLSIGSAEIDGVIEKQNQLKNLQDAGAQSSGQLERFIQTDLLNEKLRGLQRAQQLESDASAARRQGLQDELARVREISDARIEGLQAATPAEQRLAEIRRGKLQNEARSGATEEDRVAAQAQLERLDREKEIAAEQKRAKAEQKALEAAAKTEAMNAQATERAFREEQYQIQEKIYQLARVEILERLKAAQTVLDARKADAKAAGEAATAQQTGATFANETQQSLELARIAADKLAKSLLDLNGKEINIKIKTTGTQGLWTGGPATGGTTYRVNELGREGFLSNSGRLAPINKPRNALWKAPTSGIVIPAHIMKSIEAPGASVKIPGSTMSKVSGSVRSSGGMSILARELRKIANTGGNSELKNEIATTHAAQTMEIGRLTRAVRDLVDKDWNVNVKVRNNGGTTYMNALNRLG